MQNDDRESTRLALQARLDRAKTQAERNRMGQFATPGGLALDILAHARMLMPPDMDIRFLDPGFGTGSFYSALLRTFPRDRIEAAKGYEIDPHYATPAGELWGDTALRLHMADFTRATPPQVETQKFNMVICNHPMSDITTLPTVRSYG